MPRSAWVSDAALAEAFMSIPRLPHAGDDSVDDEGGGVEPGFVSEFELLFCIEGSGVGIVAGEEVGEDPDQALLFFDLDLGLGDGGLIFADVDVGVKNSDGQFCLGKNQGFPGVQLAGDFLRSEALSVHGQVKRAGGDV